MNYRDRDGYEAGEQSTPEIWALMNCEEG
jgi:hypothetical protein